MYRSRPWKAVSVTRSYQTSLYLVRSLLYLSDNQPSSCLPVGTLSCFDLAEVTFPQGYSNFMSLRYCNLFKARCIWYFLAELDVDTVWWSTWSHFLHHFISDLPILKSSSILPHFCERYSLRRCLLLFLWHTLPISCFITRYLHLKRVNKSSGSLHCWRLLLQWVLTIGLPLLSYFACIIAHAWIRNHFSHAWFVISGCQQIWQWDSSQAG